MGGNIRATNLARLGGVRALNVQRVKKGLRGTILFHPGGDVVVHFGSVCKGCRDPFGSGEVEEVGLRKKYQVSHIFFFIFFFYN